MFVNKSLAVLLFTIIVVLTSSLSFSLVSYYYTDNTFTRYVHDISINRDFFEVLGQKYNIFGIPWIPFNRNLNFLSYLNYDLKSYDGYLLYLFTLRICELIPYLLFIIYFSKKYFSFTHIIIFLLFIYQFNVFDHQSYVNFPIIIFNVGIGLCLLFQKNKKIFVTIFFISNFWSYFVNPSYFIVTCLGPFLVLICILLYEKKYKLLTLSILVNLPFTLMYVGISLGTARFALGNLVTSEVYSSYNFNIFNSKLHILTLLLMCIYLIFFYKTNIKRFFTKELLIFLGITFLTIVLSLLKKYKLLLNGLPHFSYIDYSLQYFYLSVFSCFFSKTNLKEKYFFNLLFISLIIFKIYQHRSLLTDYTNIVNKNSLAIENTKLIKRYFWQVNEKFKFESKYKNKAIVLELGNADSEFVKYICNGKVFVNRCNNETLLMYNNILKHSFVWHEFQDNKLMVNLGHSLMLGINTSAFNYMEINENTRISKNSVPKISHNSPIYINFNFDYILSDKILNYEVEEIINYDVFNLYIYKYPKKKNFKILNIKRINSLKDYKKNSFKFANNLFVSDNYKKLKSSKLKYFCNFEYIFDESKYSQYLINFNANENCFFVFPIPFSRTNDFYINNNKIETIKAQYYFHGGLFKNGDLITYKKKNLILYSWYSFLDFLEFRRNNRYYD